MVSRKRKQYTMPMKRGKTNRTKKTKKKIKKKQTCPIRPPQVVFGQQDVRELIFGEKRRALKRDAYRRFNPFNEYVFDVDAGTADNPIVL